MQDRTTLLIRQQLFHFSMLKLSVEVCLSSCKNNFRQKRV